MRRYNKVFVKYQAQRGVLTPTLLRTPLLQTVKKTCNCRYTRTKYSTTTRSDDLAEVVIAKL